MPPARCCAPSLGATLLLVLLLGACAAPGPDTAADAETASANGDAGRSAGVRAFERGEYERARPLLAREAEGGNPLAARYLGRIHLEGIKVDRDRAAAGRAFHRGAVLGDAISQVRLAKLYYDGLDFETDHRKARYWFRRAAAQGNAEAQYALYNMLLQGLGGDIRVRPALAWAWLASENGQPGAQRAWGNRELLIDASTAAAIRSGHGPRRLPARPRFDDAAVAALRAAPGTGGGATVEPVQLRLRLADEEEIRVVGVRDMEGVTPVDGVNHPWIAYSVVEITDVLQQVARGLEGEASMIEVRVMTEVARAGGEKLRVRTRAFRRESQ